MKLTVIDDIYEVSVNIDDYPNSLGKYFEAAEGIARMLWGDNMVDKKLSE